MDKPSNLHRLLTVKIREYKNIASVDLHWSHAGVLFGPNGAGKTNLLECLALLFGTDRTLKLIEGRALLPVRGQLECLAEVPSRRLPLPPDIARRLLRVSALEPRAEADLRWWKELGSTSGATISEALASADIPPALSTALAHHSSRPTIKFRLAAMHAYAGAARIFEPEWTLPFLPEEVAEAANSLPAAFDPLRRSLSETDGPVPVLALPATTRAPARLEWLARTRSSLEVTNDLIATFEEALPHAAQLAGLMSSVISTSDEFEPDPHWWLHVVGSNHAVQELMQTSPSVGIDSRGDETATWMVSSNEHDIATTRDLHFLTPLSSAERRWADEALATAARRIEDLGRRSQWQALFWDQVEESGEKDVWAELFDLIAVVEHDGYVGGEVLERVAELFDISLAAAAQQWSADTEGFEILHALLPAIADLADPPLNIRVFDEPEAHLHPSAQRGIREALTTIGHWGDDVLISTHSPYLLSQREWRYTKIVDGGASDLPKDDLRATEAFAREVGLTTGELLTTTRRVLVVEGIQDELVLRVLYEDQLSDAGVIIVPIHGTQGARALLDSEFWLRFSALPFTVMFDNASLEKVDRPAVRDGQLTSEEKVMRTLTREVNRQGRKLRRIGLERPDITAYLAEELFATESKFPGWDEVIATYRRENARSFKEYVKARYSIDLSTPSVERLLQEMKTRKLRPAAELERKIKQLCASRE